MCLYWEYYTPDYAWDDEFPYKIGKATRYSLPATRISSGDPSWKGCASTERSIC